MWRFGQRAFGTLKAFYFLFFFSRYIHITVSKASLIHSLAWPLSLPLLSGEILRGFTLEFLPCAFYPLLTHSHMYTLPHTSQHCPRISKKQKTCIFVSVYLCVFKANQIDADFLDNVHNLDFNPRPLCR